MVSQESCFFQAAGISSESRQLKSKWKVNSPRAIKGVPGNYYAEKACTRMPVLDRATGKFSRSGCAERFAQSSCPAPGGRAPAGTNSQAEMVSSWQASSAHRNV